MLATPAPFLNDAGRFTRRVHAVHWLFRYLDQHAAARVRVAYIENRSLTANERSVIEEWLARLKTSWLMLYIDDPLKDAISFDLLDNGKTAAWIALRDGTSFCFAGDRLPAGLCDEPGRLIDVDGNVVTARPSWVEQLIDVALLR